MKVKILLLIVTLVIATISCGEDTSGLNYGKIEGKVSDAQTLELISNCEISTIPATSVVKTNVAGYYILNDIMPGQYEVIATAYGYKSKKLVINVLSKKHTIADFLLEKIGTDGDGNDNDDKDLSLIAHYQFDNNLRNEIDKQVDLIGQGYSFFPDRNNNSNSSIQFSGNYNSYIENPNIEIFNLNRFTYAFWIKPNAPIGVAYNNHIDIISRWGSWGASKQSFAFSLSNIGHIKGMLYTLNNYESGHPSNYTFFETKNSLKIDSWSHVAITYNQNVIEVFINGVLELSTQSVQPQSSSMYGLTIGKRPNEQQISCFNGAIDDFRVYNKALNLQEINALLD